MGRFARRSLFVVVCCAAGCHLIGDFGHLSIREDGGDGGSAGADCVPTGAELCDNGSDDDCNGATDCNDSACRDTSCESLGATCGTADHPCGGMLACDNTIADGDETDVDCGGDVTTCATRCPDDAACLVDGDCASGICDVICVAPSCGDSVVNGTEACDDGDQDAYDGCSSTCQLEGPHLLISEVADQGAGEEFIEIYNPSDTAVSLDDIFIADYALYYEVTQGGTPPSVADFVAQFPPNSTIPPRGFVVVSLEAATDFMGQYSSLPDFDFNPADLGAPAMLGIVDDTPDLHDDTGMVVLFRWDGASDLVQDIDYLLYGDNNTSAAMDKTGVTVNASAYLPDTAPALQAPRKSEGGGKSLYRCDTSEDSETRIGGNGETGHDESSEDFDNAFRKADPSTPGMAPDDLSACK